MNKEELSLEEFIEKYCIECEKELPNHNIFFDDAKDIGFFCSEECRTWFKDSNNVSEETEDNLCECGHFNTDHKEIDDNCVPCSIMNCNCDDFNTMENYVRELST